jgi:hypothetical protein
MCVPNQPRLVGHILACRFTWYLFDFFLCQAKKQATAVAATRELEVGDDWLSSVSVLGSYDELLRGVHKEMQSIFRELAGQMTKDSSASKRTLTR